MNIPILNLSTWLVLKIFILVGLVVYLLFSLMVVRQIRLMTETLKVSAEGVLRTVSYFYLSLAIGILILALIIL